MSDKESDKQRDIKCDKTSKVEADDASTFSALTKPTDNAADANAEALPDKEIDEAAPVDNDASQAANSPNSSMTNIAPETKPTQANNPLHGVKLQTIVEELEAEYGWDGLAYRININCFKSDASVKSSLKFLRRTPWAREKVERLYLKTFHKKYRPESY
tara:strand:- start:21 stop:497 length:477 start_codon:yes stop_codon:yes gene_type:complete